MNNPADINDTRWQDSIQIDKCTHALGASGFTRVVILELTDKERTTRLKHGDQCRSRYEARMGFALFGQTNMDDDALRDCEANPFHPEFYDNYVTGHGNTHEEAMTAMASELEEISQSLFRD